MAAPQRSQACRSISRRSCSPTARSPRSRPRWSRAAATRRERRGRAATAAWASAACGSRRSRWPNDEEPSFPRSRADHRRRLGGDREGSQAHAARACWRRAAWSISAVRWAGTIPRSRSAAPTRSPRRPSGRDVQARLRRIQPLVELRIPFDVARAELDAIDRGARDPDLDSVIAAAREIAIAEDRSIFHGYEAAHITGICQAQRRRRGAARREPCRLSRRGVGGAHQAARRGRRGPVRRGAERAALQGSRGAHRQRLSDPEPRPAADRRRHRVGGRPRRRPGDLACAAATSS